MILEICREIFDNTIGRTKVATNFFRYKQQKNLAKASKNYYKGVEIDPIQNIFADEESKNVYRSMIRYRMTRRQKDHSGVSTGLQYFPSELIRKDSTNHCFIDCGAFVGDTIIDFMKYFEKQYNSIVCFEPDEDNLCVLKKALKNEKNITFIKKGIWDTNQKLRFLKDVQGTVNGAGYLESASMSGIPQIDGNVEHIVEVIALDNVFECKEASFIKMDIEGSEWNAIHGAANTIINNHPILAISIYHSDEDMIRIPLYDYH